MTEHRSDKRPFKPRARLLLLLGDQLIRDAGIAVFELVKNGYDADATKVTVTLHDIEDASNASIVIEDDGSGMDWETVTETWMEPGTDYRSRQFNQRERTKKYHRLPLGEKGVGRFAAHKLGREIALISRQHRKPEVVVQIDWGDFERARYIGDVTIEVTERPPRVFSGSRAGTRIEITRLKEVWTRGMVRGLHRQIHSICSPFARPDDFQADLVLDPDPGWLEGLLDSDSVLESALFRAKCEIDGNHLAYDYKFAPLPAMDRVEGRTARQKHMDLPADSSLTESEGQPLRIGKVTLDLHIFDRDPQVLALGVADKKGLREFLDQNGGIRVYRDGVRVYDYGEPGNDWLNLSLERVNAPTKRISNNIVIGAASLTHDQSEDLIEKTNREGFVENAAFQHFRSAVVFAVRQIEAERNKDKERIRTAYARGRQKEPVLEDLSRLREAVETLNSQRELGGYIDRVESQFREVRDRLLTAAGAGLTLATVIHEVEKGINSMVTALRRQAPLEQVRQLGEHLAELTEGLTYLTRKSGTTKEKASVLIRHALFNTDYRLRYHSIKAINGIEQDEDSDFTVRCTRRLIIASLMNLIDNSIYWLDTKGAKDKRLYLGTTTSLPHGPALIVADNGPGFIDPPEYLVQAFFTRKPDGMGLGLHLASEVAKAHGGRLAFPDDGELALPRQFTGAIVALEFPNQN